MGYRSSVLQVGKQDRLADRGDGNEIWRKWTGWYAARPRQGDAQQRRAEQQSHGRWVNREVVLGRHQRRRRVGIPQAEHRCGGGADREKPPRSSCAAHRTRLTRNSTGQRFGPYRVAPDLQVFCAGDQNAPLSPPRVAVPLAAWRALRPHRHMLLHQYPGVVARERGRIQPGLCFGDESRSLSAGFDASRSAVRFHGAHASISLAANDQSERHGVRLLHIDVSHVRRRLRHVLAVQGAPLRAAAMESAAAIAGPAKTFPSAKEGISAVEVAIAEGERSLKWWRPRLKTKQKG